MKVLVFLMLFALLGGMSPVNAQNITSPELYLAQGGTCRGGQGKIFQHGERHPDRKRICLDGQWGCIGGQGKIYRSGEKHHDGRRVCINGQWAG